MSTINSVQPVPYSAPVANPSTATSSSSTAKPAIFQDAIELSLAGRIALGVNDGKLTSDQVLELNSQLTTLDQQVQSGGPGVSNLQNLLSQQIYSDAHNGASIPTNFTVTPADKRDIEEAGRVALQENAGKLSSTQGSQFLSQIEQIYQFSQGGASASATNQVQNQLSAEIYSAVHPASGTPAS